MYEAFVTQGPERRDGMVHVTVEFRGDGLETVTRKTFTDTFTAAWFKGWCLQQLEGLNRPQETDAVVAGKVDLTGVSLEPDAVTKARRDFDERFVNIERMLRLVAAGVLAADDADIVKVRGEMVAAIAARPGLKKSK